MQDKKISVCMHIQVHRITVFPRYVKSLCSCHQPDSNINFHTKKDLSLFVFLMPYRNYQALLSHFTMIWFRKNSITKNLETKWKKNQELFEKRRKFHLSYMNYSYSQLSCSSTFKLKKCVRENIFFCDFIFFPDI